ncbi:hypothetical protein ACFPRL_05140 [Pseudoclavibacter helvolus]
MRASGSRARSVSSRRSASALPEAAPMNECTGARSAPTRTTPPSSRARRSRARTSAADARSCSGATGRPTTKLQPSSRSDASRRSVTSRRVMRVTAACSAEIVTSFVSKRLRHRCSSLVAFAAAGAQPTTTRSVLTRASPPAACASSSRHSSPSCPMSGRAKTSSASRRSGTSSWPGATLPEVRCLAMSSSMPWAVVRKACAVDPAGGAASTSRVPRAAPPRLRSG